MQLLHKETYLQMLRNSAGTAMFRNSYALVNGEKQDILRDGDVSCAYFVSSVLYHFSLIKELHATVSGTEKDLEASGWQKTEKIIPGAVIVWEPQVQASGEVHPHIGFALDENRAVSTSYRTRTVVEHDVAGNTENSARPVVAIYTHPFLLTE